MKKILYPLLLAASLVLFFGCGDKPAENPNNQNTEQNNNSENTDNTDKSDKTDDDQNKDDNTDDSEQTDEQIIYKINAGKTTALTGHSWYIAAISLGDYPNEMVDIEFSAQMKVTNTGDEKALTWTVNGKDLSGKAKYTTIATSKFAKGTSDWIAVKGTKEGISLAESSSLYISTYDIKPENFTIYLKDVSVKVSGSKDKTYKEIAKTDGITTVKAADVPAKSEAAEETTDDTTEDTTENKKDDTDTSGSTDNTENSGNNNETEDTGNSGNTEESDNTDDSGNTENSGESDNTVDPSDSTEKSNNWLSTDVPSLYETYKNQFDYIGIAAEYGNFGISCSGNKYTGTYTANGYWGTPSELYYEEVQKGVAKHANSITLGNEMKPQFLLQWWSGDGSSQTMVDFTASNGKTIKVPNQLNGENLIYATLNVAKKMGVQMRGHVLTWHSQTPDGFFAEGYKPEYDGDLITNLVDADTMTARHEWYIKTVLECVKEWEAANNYGEGNHIIWAWDVVNEAMADDAGNTYTGTSQNWLRGSTAETKNKSPSNGGGSRWYQVYGNEEFIVNAFRFANAYAPSDVKLCYNDYNEYWDAAGHYKTSAICHIVETIKAGAAQTVNGSSVSPRIDVVAMQSHVGTSWPGVSGYESALKRFLALGCDIHVSELDFSAATAAEAKTAYADYFTMLQKYGKKSSGTNKITNVTIWGINNESSWINPSSAGGKKTYPLLFNLDDKVTTTMKDVTYDTGDAKLPQYDIGDTYNANDSFWAVINAHQ